MAGDRYPRPDIDQEGKYLDQEGKATRREKERERERESVCVCVFCSSQLDLNQEGVTGQPVPWSVGLVWPVSRLVHHFWPKNLYFLCYFLF